METKYKIILQCPMGCEIHYISPKNTSPPIICSYCGEKLKEVE
jgi:hypothetical protein